MGLQSHHLCSIKILHALSQIGYGPLVAGHSDPRCATVASGHPWHLPRSCNGRHQPKLSVLPLSVTQLRHERCCSCLFHCQWVVEDHRIFLNFEISKSLIFFWGGKRVTKGFDQPLARSTLCMGLDSAVPRSCSLWKTWPSMAWVGSLILEPLGTD